MTRRELREHGFKMLFRIDFYKEEEIPEQFKYYLEYFSEMEEKDRLYLHDKSHDVFARLKQLDEKINGVAEGWKTKRMGKVDLTIIRLALYEILYDDSVPTKVAINEAVELAKHYGGDESPAFINGILAKLV